MSNRRFVEKLLDGVEVEWKALGDVVQTVTASAKLKKDAYCETGSIPIIDQGASFLAGYTDEDLQTLPNDNYIIFGDHSEHIKYVDFAFIQGADGLKILKPVSGSAKYIYYAFQNFYRKELSYKRHWSKAKNTIIPIPCPNNPEKSLAIQAEIVRILDTFTELTTELTTELSARKKQYNYYRDQLLSFDDGTTKDTKSTKGVKVEWKALGEVAENLDSMRKPITSGLRDSGKIPYYGASGIVDYVKDYIFDGDFLLVSEDGANLTARKTPIAFSVSGKSWVNNHAHILKFNTYAERRFVEFYLNSIDLTPYISGAAQPKLNQKNLNSIKIPPFSPTEQARIVAILDKFDTLTSSISEGLPREIELRQKQYAYYRDLLLSFPKPEVAV